MLVAKTIAIFLFGTCLMLMSMTKDIRRELRHIGKCNRKESQQQAQIKKRFCELIRVHWSAIQLSESFKHQIFLFSFKNIDENLSLG